MKNGSDDNMQTFADDGAGDVEALVERPDALILQRLREGCRQMQFTPGMAAAFDAIGRLTIGGLPVALRGVDSEFGACATAAMLVALMPACESPAGAHALALQLNVVTLAAHGAALAVNDDGRLMLLQPIDLAVVDSPGLGAALRRFAETGHALKAGLGLGPGASGRA